MFDFRTSFSVLLFCTVVGSTIGAVVPPSSLTRSKSESFISDEETSVVETASWISQPTRSISSNSVKIIVNLNSLDNKLRQILCTCVVLYDCSEDDFVMLPPGSSAQDICSRPDVCCKSAISTSTEENELSQPVTIKSIIYGIYDDGERRNLECECMAEFLCLDEDVIALPTTYSNGVCQMPDVCCKSSTSTLPMISQLTEPPISSTISQPTELSTSSMISQSSEPPYSSTISQPSKLPISIMILLSAETSTSTPILQQSELATSPTISQTIDSPISPTISQPIDPISSSSAKEIIYGLSEDDERRELKCECLLFSECSEENFIQTPTAYSNGDQCLMPDACCKKSTETLPAILQQTEPTSSNDTKFIIYESSDDDEHRELKCECVPYYECSDEDSIPLPTPYSNGEQCPLPDICCKRATSTPTEPTSYYNNNPKTIIYGLSDGNEFRELKCECLASYICPVEDVITLPTTYNNKDQCSCTNVCCKYSTSSSTPRTTERKPSNAGDVISIGMWGSMGNQAVFGRFAVFLTYAYFIAAQQYF